jgi:hypothetical protein
MKLKANHKFKVKASIVPKSNCYVTMKLHQLALLLRPTHFDYIRNSLGVIEHFVMK